MKIFRFLIILFFLSVNAFAQTSTGWRTIYESNIGKIDIMVTINDPNAKKHMWHSGVYFRTNIPYSVQIEVNCKEIIAGFDNGKPRFNDYLQGTFFTKASNWRESGVLTSDVRSFKGLYVKYLEIENQVLFRDGQEISQFYYNTNSSNNSSSTNQNNSTNNSNFKNFTDLVNEHNRVCQELMNTANSAGKNSNLLVKYCQQGGTVNDSESNRIRINNEINEMNNEIHNLKYSNNSGNKTNSEGTGWNGNNGNSNNNYNQQIQNQNSKTTEAFDLYNSTGNYEEARRKLIEAKNNAPDEASRQVAQQNIDKLDKVERKNQNVETISKTIDFTTDLIKTIREQKEKNILAQIEQSQKERMEKYELYSNKLLVQLEKINNLESNTKTYDDYKILIKDFKELKKIYQELYYSVPMNDMVEYKIKQDYFKVREKESQIRFNKTLLKMYESGYLLNHNEIDQIIDFSNFILISNIIDILKNNPLNDIGKSSYEIAYLSNKTVSHILSLNKNNKIENKEDINTYLKYFLDNEYKYLEISNNNNYTDASFKKNIYLLSGWYNLKPDINTAISNLQILVNSKKINERYTSKGFYQNCTVDKIYSSYNISLENVKAINSLFIEESGKASVAKKIKQEFDKALISFGYNTIPSDDYNKKSPIFYKNIGEIYFDSNGIDIRFSSLENAIIFKNFNVYFYLINEYDKTNYFFPTTDLKIIKNEINTHNYFFKLITNQ